MFNETSMGVDSIGADAPFSENHSSTEKPTAAEIHAHAELPANGFALLDLPAPLQQAVSDLGFSNPTSVQARVIPLCLENRTDAATGEPLGQDLMVSSQTGSGKTAAFLLPVLQRVLGLLDSQKKQEAVQWQAMVDQAAAQGKPAPKRPKRFDPTNPRHFKPAKPLALVLCPTRELAQQVAHDAIDLVKHCKGVRIANVVGGMPYPVQIAKLQNANLVVATPGRLLDLYNGGQLHLNDVQFLVLDEADRMLDLGFSDDLAAIHDATEQRRQTLMFSATFEPSIQKLAMRIMREPQRIQVDSAQAKHRNISQSIYWADNPRHKRQLLDHWLRDTKIEQAIVFASTQVECDELANDLQQEGFSAVGLHGALSQSLRNRRLMALREGRVQILVATDVAARGIDVPSISHVFNFGLPMKSEDYVHRIGRTGRAGRDGLAITFAEFRQRRKVFDIEQYTKQPIKSEVIEGLEPREQPVKKPRSNGKPSPRFGAREDSRKPFGQKPKFDNARDRFAAPADTAHRSDRRSAQTTEKRGSSHARPSSGNQWSNAKPAPRGKAPSGRHGGKQQFGR